MSEFMREDNNKIIFHRPIKQHNFKTYTKNQDVDLKFADHVVTVTSNQDISTPGIFITRKLIIPRNTFYEFIVKGRAIGGATPFLFGDQNNNRDLRISGYSDETTKYLTEDLKSVSTVVGGFNVPTSVRLGIMFQDPDIGQQFQISSLAVIRKTVYNLVIFVCMKCLNI